MDNMTLENSPEPNEDPGLVPAPMRSLYEVTKLRNLRSYPMEKPMPKSTLLEEDFISRGYVSLHEAEELFAYFSRTMNQLLWGGILLVHKDLTSVRRASSLLSAAVLTVAALHIPNRTETLNRCYDEYVSLVSSMSLTRTHTLDDIRALCVGAFWLSDLSWKLSGHAVRIATELGLHQSFQKMTRGRTDQYERAQLWYLLYVCDHHFSIAYGRPPVIHEDAAIRNYEVFLQSPLVVPGDIRLMAQVALFVILTEAYRTFGSDTETVLTEEDFGQLRVYNVAVDQWRLLWQPRSGKSSLPPPPPTALHMSIYIYIPILTDINKIKKSRQPLRPHLPLQRRHPALPLRQIPTQLPLPPRPVPHEYTHLLARPQGIRQPRHRLRHGLFVHGPRRARHPGRHRRRPHLHAYHGHLLGGLSAEGRGELELGVFEYRWTAGETARREGHRVDELCERRGEASHETYRPRTGEDAGEV